jgi:putative membrane protein
MGDSYSSAATTVENHPKTHGLSVSPPVDEKRQASMEVPLEHVRSPTSPGVPATPMDFGRSHSLDLDDYFTGPRDISRHSKWPDFMRMHGSILPKMIMPLLAMGSWATCITTIHALEIADLGVSSVLLTITGFVISLGLSFRSSTAYERYNEGRRYWGQLNLAAQSLGRVFWIHALDAQDTDIRLSTIQKITSMNLVVAFAISLKHTLRFEPYSSYPDLQTLVGHLQTFSLEATKADPEMQKPRKKNFFKEMGEYLGVSFAASNPRKALKKASRATGNLPLEILNHLAITVDTMIRRGQLDIPMQQTLAYNNLALMNDIMTGCERILSTPLPIAYTIAIAQITWVYVILLPFQLVEPLGWIAIPATVVATYIILGLLMIGREIENPFGDDVNDLPLDLFCEQIAREMDIIAAYDKREPEAFVTSNYNIPLYPVSTAPVSTWLARDEEKLREAIKSKPQTTFSWRQTRDNSFTKEKVVVGDNNV